MVAELYEDDNYFQITEAPQAHGSMNERTFLIFLSAQYSQLSEEVRSALVSLGWRFWHKDAGEVFENQIHLWVPESKLGSFETTSLGLLMNRPKFMTPNIFLLR